MYTGQRAPITETMPMITKLGVARQCTMCYEIVRDAVEHAMVWQEDEEICRDMYVRAKRYADEIGLWRQHAHRRHWDVVERHASTMEAMAEQWLLVFS